MQPVTESSAWQATELAADSAWRHTLTAAEAEEILATTRHGLKQSLRTYEFDRKQFPLPHLGPRIQELIDEVENGRGIALLQGLPIAGMPEDELRFLYWGFGIHAGTPISQNSKGQLIAKVTDKGNAYDNINTRGFSTNAELSPHVDTSDMTALLCLRAARSGGENRIVSSTSVYNAILAEHPEHLAVLYRGFHNDLRGEGRTGDIDELTENRIPVYSYHAGRVSCSFNYRMIKGAVTKSGVPLTEGEEAALDCLRAVANRESLSYRFTLSPGDILIVSNHSVFHSRTEYVDYDEPERKRCLLRIWMNAREGRPLAPEFADRYNTGPRGGVAVGTGAQYDF